MRPLSAPVLSAVGHCALCGLPIYGFELAECPCYVTPSGDAICNVCIATVSVSEVLEYLGCVRLSVS